MEEKNVQSPRELSEEQLEMSSGGRKSGETCICSVCGTVGELVYFIGGLTACLCPNCGGFKPNEPLC